MKPSVAAHRLRAAGLPADEAAATFLMLGAVVAKGDAAGVRKVARFRLTRMRQEFGPGRFLMADFW